VNCCTVLSLQRQLAARLPGRFRETKSNIVRQYNPILIFTIYIYIHGKLADDGLQVYPKQVEVD